MEALVNPEFSRNLRRPRQAGFSMIEFLITAFILAIGILGLTMLQVMAMRASTGSRALNTAVVVGEGVIESIQAEGRQRMLFLKFGGTAPATTFFGGAASITRYYAFDGTLLASATNAFYTAVVSSSDVVALGLAGGTKRFTLVLTFAGTPDPANPTATITRSVTLTRQVAYA
jgi:prepilin-type N-terminal cleavage/methylation domain-containing protein